jgi:TNF receptor-associated factor 5
MVNQQQNKFDLRSLVEAIDTVKQKITLLETNDQRLGMFSILLLFW